ncbi:MAG: cyclic nucleotide-binding domain-containing protein [Desulfosarcina sp.]|nr:cyclic nucleotide-binding domain-containing protein [Desulfobacterales bacterium]
MQESRYLKDNLENIQKLLSIPALRNFETSNLSRLLHLSKIREYEAGEKIIQEGDNDPWLYFLIEGRIRIEKKGIEIGVFTERGEIFGEMRVIDSRARSATVVALEDTVCLAVNTAATDRMESLEGRDEQLDFLLLLYRIFAEFLSIRLRLTSEELIKAQKRLKALE